MYMPARRPLSPRPARRGLHKERSVARSTDDRPAADPSPLLAMGMISAPFAAGRRRQVRKTMLTLRTVTRNETVFRFVVGSILPQLDRCHGAACAADRVKHQALREEEAHFGDLVELEGLDGEGVFNCCSCTEKLHSWMRYALSRWPGALYIGKTEDDTYVQLEVLAAELRALLQHENVLYGHMTVAALPTRPTALTPRMPGGESCVSTSKRCRGEAKRCRLLGPPSRKPCQTLPALSSTGATRRAAFLATSTSTGSVFRPRSRLRRGRR